MSAEKKQIQSFNGKEQIELKQGPGRFNLFTTLEDLWTKYFKAKTQDLIDASSSSYTVYTALIAQSGSNPPTETAVLENNTGCTFTYDYVTDGTYKVTKSGNAFDVDKTIVFTTVMQTAQWIFVSFSGNDMFIYSADWNNAASYQNGILAAGIEIRIYQ